MIVTDNFDYLLIKSDAMQNGVTFYICSSEIYRQKEPSV